MSAKTQTIITGTLLVLIMLSFATALTVDATYVTLLPGEQKSVRIEVDNNFNFDIEDVSVSVNTGGLPLTVIGSSQEDIDDLDEDDDDTASFTLRANTDAVPGDYEIPYTVFFKDVDDNDKDQQSGTFAIRISAETEIDFATETENPIRGQQGKVTLEVINEGLGDIKFVSIELLPSTSYTLLSGNKEYIGTIDSDDSDFATFDVMFDSTTASLQAKVRYKDFENTDQEQIVSLPLTVYSREKAIELGLIEESKTVLYGGIIVAIIIIWLVYRRIKKRRKNKNKGR